MHHCLNIRILLLLSCLQLTLAAESLRAAPPGWIPETNMQYSMNVIARVIQTDGTHFMHANDILAAFSGSSCRGLISPLSGTGGLFFLSIASNQYSGEDIVFKIWSYAQDAVFDLEESVSFEAFTLTGTIDQPFLLHVVQEVPRYYIGLSVSPPEGGTVSGEGYYFQHQQVVVQATAAVNHVFIHWTENGVAVSDTDTYSFTALADRNLVAVFQETTGLNESEVLNHCVLYPNPASNYVCLECHLPFIMPGQPGALWLVLSDLQGKNHREWMAWPEGGRLLALMPLDGLEPGYYLLSIYGPADGSGPERGSRLAVIRLVLLH